MTIAIVFSFILTCFVIELTPGPNMAYLAVLVLSKGKRAGYFALLGVALGLLIVGVVTALGVATIISQSFLAYQALRWCGVFYLLWMAWETWSGENDNKLIEKQSDYKDSGYFRRGLIVNLLNPKAALFYVAILPRFIDASGNISRQSVALAFIYVLVATSVHALIVELASFVRQFLNNKQHTNLVRRCLAASLIIIAIWFAIATR